MLFQLANKYSVSTTELKDIEAAIRVKYKIVYKPGSTCKGAHY